jgi:23S rRNA pseudoU1915 N3-methylase RlmH
VNFMPRPKKQAANGAESGQVNKAELIRQTARSMPKPVRPRDIIAILKAKGVTVTSPQVSKTLKQAGFKRKGRRRKSAAANGAGDVSKAERIRQLAKAMGKSVRPRDIVATMAKEGVKVASAQVSTVLAAAGYRRKGRKGRKGRRRAATAGTNSIARSAGQSLDIEALVAAKALVAKVGGLDRAEAALSVLKKLQ